MKTFYQDGVTLDGGGAFGMVDERDDDGSYIGRTRYDAPEIDNSVIFVPKREHGTAARVQRWREIHMR